MHPEPIGAVAKRDARKLIKTKTPGIYRRRNGDGSLGQYVVIYRAGGKQRREYTSTLDEARRVKREREADRDRGEWQERTTATLRAFLAEWVERYYGTGRRGFRESTRAEYRRLLEIYAYRYFPEGLRLADVTPTTLAQFVGWLADEHKQGQRAAEDRRAALARRRGVPIHAVRSPEAEPLRLADSTIANALMPVRAALATAQREGLIRHNPAVRLALPRREEIHEEEQEQVRALSRAQLSGLLALAPERHRVLLHLLASTGLRISEAIALQRRHVELDAEAPHLLVRRALVRKRFEPPKSRHGRRAVPLPAKLVDMLRAHLDQVDGSAEALVFSSERGTPLDPDNLRSRMLKPLVEEVGAPWAAFHSLRHTYASLQLAGGTNMLQLSRALGHHSPSFTLERYCHLLDGDLAPPLDLDDALGVNAGVNESDGSPPNSIDAELAEILA